MINGEPESYPSILLSNIRYQIAILESALQSISDFKVYKGINHDYYIFGME